MDNTIIYIKMSEMAKEIQCMRNDKSLNTSWQIADIVCPVTHNRYQIKAYKVIDRWKNKIKVFPGIEFEQDILIWLPKQDQLQKMVFDNTALRTAVKFWNFCLTKASVINGNTYSMEQLWLAYVMKEKYNKVWKDNQWVIQ